MKKKLLASLGLLFSMGASAENIYSACMDCSVSDVKALVQADLDSRISAYPDNSGDSEATFTGTYHYYTNSGDDKGYVFVGSIRNNKTTVFKPWVVQESAKTYFNAMDDYRIAILNMLAEAEASLAEYTGVTEADVEGHKAAWQPNKVPNGKCDNNIPINSVFDYFKPDNRVIIESQIIRVLDAYKPETQARVDSVNASLGAQREGLSGSAGLNIVFTAVNQPLRSYFGRDGGYLEFVVTPVTPGATSYNFSLNLNSSRTGRINDHAANARLDLYLMPDGNGGYKPTSHPAQFSDPCKDEDYMDALEAMEISVEPEGDLARQYANNMDAARGCHSVMANTNTIYWETYQTRAVRKPDGRLVFKLVVVTHTLNMAQASDFEASCGRAVPILGGG